MNKVFFLVVSVALAVGAASCKKCVDCTTTTTIEYTANDPDDQAFYDGLYSEESITREKCDKKKDIEDYEDANSEVTTTSDSFATATYTTATICD